MVDEKRASKLAGTLDRVMIPVPDPCPPVHAIRGSALAISRRFVRERGCEDRYFEALDPDYHAAIRGLLSASWVPIDVALAHYTTMDALDFDDDELITNGQALATKLHNSFVGTIVRGLRAAGLVSPLQLVPRVSFLWSRSVQGGGISLIQNAPKDVDITIHRLPLMQLRYCRIAFGGVIEATVGLAAQKLFVSARNVSAESGTYHLAWA